MGWASGLWETWPGATDPLQITIWRQERLHQNNGRTAGGAQLKLTGRGDKSFMCYAQWGQLTLIVEQGQGLTAAGLNRNWISNSYCSVFIQGVLQLLAVSWFRCFIRWMVHFNLCRPVKESTLVWTHQWRHTDWHWNTKLFSRRSSDTKIWKWTDILRRNRYINNSNEK